MILTTFTIITGVGIAMFVIGNLLGFNELAVVGGVIVLGAGGVGMVDGIEVKTGEVETTTNNTTTTDYQYEDISEVQSFPFDLVVLLAGALMMVVSYGRLEQA